MGVGWGGGVFIPWFTVLQTILAIFTFLEQMSYYLVTNVRDVRDVIHSEDLTEVHCD